MAKFLGIAIVATALVMGVVGFLMLPAPQGSTVGLLMRPAETRGLLMQPSNTAYPSSERVGFIMTPIDGQRPSPNRVGFIMR